MPPAFWSCQQRCGRGARPPTSFWHMPQAAGTPVLAVTKGFTHRETLFGTGAKRLTSVFVPLRLTPLGGTITLLSFRRETLGNSSSPLEEYSPARQEIRARGVCHARNSIVRLDLASSSRTGGGGMRRSPTLNTVAESTSAAGKVKTQASPILPTVAPRMPEWFAHIVSATPKERFAPRSNAIHLSRRVRFSTALSS